MTTNDPFDPAPPAGDRDNQPAPHPDPESRPSSRPPGDHRPPDAVPPGDYRPPDALPPEDYRPPDAVPPGDFPPPGRPGAYPAPGSQPRPLQYPSTGESARYPAYPAPGSQPRPLQFPQHQPPVNGGYGAGHDPYGAPPAQQPLPQYHPEAGHSGGAYPGVAPSPYQQHQLPGGLQGPPPYATSPPKRRRWLWLILAVPLLGLLGIGGCTALLVRSLSGPLDATNAFVANLDEGDFDAAYSSLCQASRDSVPADRWTAEIETALGGEITDYRFTETSISSVNGRSTATVTGTIEVDGFGRSVSYGLVEEGSVWRVCSAES